jgi:hypothetical protein
MTRAELLEGASQRLLEAVLLLTVAGEDRLASDIERLAGWIDFVASHPSRQVALTMPAAARATCWFSQQRSPWGSCLDHENWCGRRESNPHGLAASGF